MRKLKCEPAKAVGLLVCMWSGVAEHAEDGDLSKVEDADLELWAQWDGAEGVLVAALIECEWIDTGTRTLNGWAKRHAQMIKERERKARFRDRKRKEVKKKRKPDGARTETSPSGDTKPDADVSVQVTMPGRGAPTGPDRTGPDPSKNLFGEVAVEDAPKRTPADLEKWWNGVAKRAGLAAVKKLTGKRHDKAASRLEEGLLSPENQAALEREIVKPNYRGENRTGWCLDLDWLIENDTNWLKIVERSERGAAPTQAQVAALSEPPEAVAHRAAIDILRSLMPDGAKVRHANALWHARHDRDGILLVPEKGGKALDPVPLVLNAVDVRSEAVRRFEVVADGRAA